MSIAITLIVLLTINYVTDFLFQTKKQGENKSHSLYWLSMHVFTFTTYFTGLLCFYNIFAHAFTWENLFLLTLINGATHFIVDFISSKCTSYFYKKTQFRAFLKTIGFDTLVHTIILIVLTFLFINVN